MRLDSPIFNQQNLIMGEVLEKERPQSGTTLGGSQGLHAPHLLARFLGIVAGAMPVEGNFSPWRCIRHRQVQKIQGRAEPFL
jgi:hypothetical protein